MENHQPFALAQPGQQIRLRFFGDFLAHIVKDQHVVGLGRVGLEQRVGVGMFDRLEADVGIVFEYLEKASFSKSWPPVTRSTRIFPDGSWAWPTPKLQAASSEIDRVRRTRRAFFMARL
jgi:hypothetical protein